MDMKDCREIIASDAPLGERLDAWMTWVKLFDTVQPSEFEL